MDIFQKILDAYQIEDYDHLQADEKATLHKWVDVVEKSAITLDDVKRGVSAMREGIESELANHTKDDRKDMFLKARLRNLIVLETILLRPEKARAALESYINRAKTNIK